MALPRLSLIKSAALLNIEAATFDSELKALAAVATEQIHQFTGRELESATYTDERYTRTDSRVLYTHQWPVTALTGVTFYDSGDEAWESESTTYFDLITPTNDRSYIYYPKLGQETSATYGAWPVIPNGIKLTYTAGFLTTSWATALITASYGVPEDLEYAAALQAALTWLEGKGSLESRMGLRRMIYDEHEIIPERGKGGIFPLVESLLGGYMRASF